MSKETTNPRSPRSKHGQPFETSVINSEATEGNKVTVIDRQVNEGDQPLDSEFGLRSSEIYNEKNTNFSRRKDEWLDIDDLFTKTSARENGLENLGADQVITTSRIVDLASAEADTYVNQGNLVLDSNVEQLDRSHGRLTEKTVAAWQPRVKTIKADADAQGRDTTETIQVVAAAAAWPTRDAKTIALVRNQIGYDKFLQTLKELVIPEGVVEADYWPTLTSYEEEPVTGKKVTVARSILTSAPTFDTNATPGEVDSVKQVSTDRWIRVLRTIDASVLTPTTFTEYHTIEYRFPAYLDPNTPVMQQVVTTPTGASSRLINILKTSEQRLRINCLFETTYHSTQPTTDEIFQFKPIDLRINTSDGTIAESGVLTDGFTVVLGTVLAMGSPQDVVVTIPPSNPTTTDYLTLMGFAGTVGDFVPNPPAVVLIADDVSKWKYNLWKRTKIKLRMPNLALSLEGSLTY